MSRQPATLGPSRVHTWEDILLDEGDEAGMDTQVSKLLVLDHAAGGAGGTPSVGGNRQRTGGKAAEQHCEQGRMISESEDFVRE